MEELQDAFDRWRASQNNLNAWLIFKEICDILDGTVPTFIWPFPATSNPPPTISQMNPHIAWWDYQYLDGPQVPPPPTTPPPPPPHGG